MELAGGLDCSEGLGKDGAGGDENGEAVDDGVAAMAAGAVDGVRDEGEGCVADGAGEAVEVGGQERGDGGHGFEFTWRGLGLRDAEADGAGWG